MTIAKIGQAAVAAAHDLWREVIVDPDDDDRLEAIIRKSGAAWTLEGGDYEESTDFWCGHFVAYCYRKVGDYLLDDRCVDLALDESIAGYMFASTDRLAGRGPESWSEFGVEAPIVVDPKHVQAGDIPVVSTGRTDDPWGDHVTLARGGPDAHGRVPTYEGNTSKGRLGNGDTVPDGKEGVTQARRAPSEIAVIYRPRLSYFVGAYLEEVDDVS